MLMNVVDAVDEMVKDVDLNLNQEILESGSDKVLLNETILTNEDSIKTENSQQDSNDNNSNEKSTTISPESNECSSETVSNFMDSLTELINDTIKNSNNTGFKRAEASDNSIILYVESEDVELPKLDGYISWLVDHILWKENRDKPERKFWDALAVRNNWLELTVTDVMSLVDINLGETNKLYVHFKDCEFPLSIELMVDNSESDWEDDNNGGNNNNGSDNNECSADIKTTFMNSLTELINDTINNSSNTGFKRAEASDNSIILYVESEDVELPKLDGYISWLVDHILWKENRDKPERKFWDALAVRNNWLELTVTNVMNLVDINLGATNKLYIYFKDCSFTLNLELKVDKPNSGWSSNDDYQCSNEVKSTLINTLAEALNGIIKNSGTTGFKRAEWSIENDTLILYVENENVKLPDLTNYILALTDYILGKNSDKAEVKFWADLASKNKWILMNVTAVTNLINLNLNKSDYVVVNYRDCKFPLKIELKVDNSSNWNGGNPYSWGWSSGWGSSNWWWSSYSSSSKWKDTSNEEIILSWEVDDDIMEVKKAESCSIEWSTFSEEENQAYLWACENWIVIADNIMKANLKRNLTRAELAKMMSIYSEELLGRTRVKSGSVSYPDVSDKLWDLAYYIQEWYRLQIMGIHADGTALSKFSPNFNVTRWEFGTVFSRVLHGGKYNIGNSHYYEKHLEVLKDEWILTNTNPKLIEKRGWILLMLYRSQKVEASNWNISNEEIANITADEEKSWN